MVMKIKKQKAQKCVSKKLKFKKPNQLDNQINYLEKK